ncbi:uncharacterized protein BO66DRAFT_4128 [Aspergillus aculeatinus CBS 121060]|uniref:Uncharacterized protein n=1 Tax=Aspergillus aculeatinus CBS 121060 TaxID=1448322 RepID=A0ACD1HNS7_9EURO|nr:hypothetical protein BO66DRAFT_4128 [Aspergillus aculeatinus CBS 121060]RAH75258.1 hypothetical protein BO66DRAFT_4128 [Aspergillus aculeatinus CBS 121060]
MAVPLVHLLSSPRARTAARTVPVRLPPRKQCLAAPVDPRQYQSLKAASSAAVSQGQLYSGTFRCRVPWQSIHCCVPSATLRLNCVECDDCPCLLRSHLRAEIVLGWPQLETNPTVVPRCTEERDILGFLLGYHSYSETGHRKYVSFVLIR